MGEKKLTDEILAEIAKNVDGIVIGRVMAIDLKTFKKSLRELNEVFKSKVPVKNFSLTGPNFILFISTFGNDKVIVVEVDDSKGNVQQIKEKIAEIINNKNPVYQIAKALQETDK